MVPIMNQNVSLFSKILLFSCCYNSTDLLASPKFQVTPGLFNAALDKQQTKKHCEDHAHILYVEPSVYASLLQTAKKRQESRKKPMTADEKAAWERLLKLYISTANFNDRYDADYPEKLLDFPISDEDKLVVFVPTADFPSEPCDIIAQLAGGTLTPLLIKERLRLYLEQSSTTWSSIVNEACDAKATRPADLVSSIDSVMSLIVDLPNFLQHQGYSSFYLKQNVKDHFNTPQQNANAELLLVFSRLGPGLTVFEQFLQSRDKVPLGQGLPLYDQLKAANPTETLIPMDQIKSEICQGLCNDGLVCLIFMIQDISQKLRNLEASQLPVPNSFAPLERVIREFCSKWKRHRDQFNDQCKHILSQRLEQLSLMAQALLRRDYRRPQFYELLSKDTTKLSDDMRGCVVDQRKFFEEFTTSPLVTEFIPQDGFDQVYLVTPTEHEVSINNYFKNFFDKSDKDKQRASSQDRQQNYAKKKTNLFELRIYYGRNDQGECDYDQFDLHVVPSYKSDKPNPKFFKNLKTKEQFEEAQRRFLKTRGDNPFGLQFLTFQQILEHVKNHRGIKRADFFDDALCQLRASLGNSLAAEQYISIHHKYLKGTFSQSAETMFSPSVIQDISKLVVLAAEGNKQRPTVTAYVLPNGEKIPNKANIQGIEAVNPSGKRFLVDALTVEPVLSVHMTRLNPPDSGPVVNCFFDLTSYVRGVFGKDGYLVTHYPWFPDEQTKSWKYFDGVSFPLNTLVEEAKISKSGDDDDDSE